MVITITLDSKSIEDRLKKEGKEEMADVLNIELGYGYNGEVWDQGGREIGTWEVKHEVKT